MKVKFEFDLDHPEDVIDQQKFKLYSQAEDMYWAVHEFTQETLRRIRKYDCPVTEEADKLFDEIDEAFFRTMRDHNVDLEVM